jgi:hypothetical protein
LNCAMSSIRQFERYGCVMDHTVSPNVAPMRESSPERRFSW